MRNGHMLSTSWRSRHWPAQVACRSRRRSGHGVRRSIGSDARLHSARADLYAHRLSCRHTTIRFTRYLLIDEHNIKRMKGAHVSNCWDDGRSFCTRMNSSIYGGRWIRGSEKRATKGGNRGSDPVLQFGAEISTPVFSALALWCHVFHSRIFQPAFVTLPRLQVLCFQYPSIQQGSTILLELYTAVLLA